MVEDYPRPPLLEAISTAAQYGLFDLERVENLILRKLAREYFLIKSWAPPTKRSPSCWKICACTRWLETELAAARKNSPSYSDFLIRLLHAEWLNQQERKLQARIKRADFPEIWTLESFPFKNQPGVSRRQIQELAELEFIPKAMNIVFIGPTAL